MDEKLSRMKQYLEENVARCTQARAQLMADDRGDEADFQAIQAIQGNVYGIFSTILNVAVEQNPGDPQGVEGFFQKKLEEIPGNWANAHQKAEERGDDVAAHLERLKLDTAEDVGRTFREIWRAEG